MRNITQKIQEHYRQVQLEKLRLNYQLLIHYKCMFIIGSKLNMPQLYN